MENTAPGKKTDWEKISFIALIALGGIIFVLLLYTLITGGTASGTRQKTNSDLISTKEIATLSLSEFVYNGIAQSINKDGTPEYNVLYKSSVKVSIPADDINYEIDETEKTVTFSFPEFKIETPVIDIGSISLIPNRTDLYMDNVIKLCRSDAFSEAQKSDKLITSAQENLRSIIEAWYSPVLEGYKFIYQFGAAEGGESK